MSSVGQSVKDEKNAAKNPANAFPNNESSSMLDLCSIVVATNF